MNGMVIEVHEAAFGSGLRYKCGRLQSDNTIIWFGGFLYGYGYYLSVAVCDNYNMIEFHTQSAFRTSGRLWYSLGDLSERKC